MTDPVVMKLKNGRVMVCTPYCPVHKDTACNEFRFKVDGHGMIEDFWWIHAIENCNETVHIAKSDMDNYVSKVSFKDIVVAPGPPDSSKDWYMKNMRKFPLKDGKLEGET